MRIDGVRRGKRMEEDLGSARRNLMASYAREILVKPFDCDA
jgi:hypothetical protein